MEQTLKFTMREAITFEAVKGISIMEWIQESAKNPAKVKISDLFMVYKLGTHIDDDEKAYEAFDAWDADFAQKLNVIGEALSDWFKKKQKQ